MWGLWERIGDRWYHDGGVLVMGVSGRPESLFSLPCRTQWGGGCLQTRERVLTTIWSGPELRLPVRLLWENKFCCLSHQIYGILLWPPELRQRISDLLRIYDRAEVRAYLYSFLCWIGILGTKVPFSKLCENWRKVKPSHFGVPVSFLHPPTP